MICKSDTSLDLLVPSDGGSGASSQFRSTTTSALSSLDDSLFQQRQMLQTLNQWSSDQLLLLQRIQGLSSTASNCSQVLLQQMNRAESSLADVVASQLGAQQAIVSSIGTTGDGLHLHLDSVLQSIYTRLPRTNELIALPANSINNILVLSLPRLEFRTVHRSYHWFLLIGWFRDAFMVRGLLMCLIHLLEPDFGYRWPAFSRCIDAVATPFQVLNHLHTAASLLLFLISITKRRKLLFIERDAVAIRQVFVEPLLLVCVAVSAGYTEAVSNTPRYTPLPISVLNTMPKEQIQLWQKHHLF